VVTQATPLAGGSNKRRFLIKDGLLSQRPVDRVRIVRS